MTTFTWSIVQMDCYPEIDGQQKVVFNAHWICQGNDGEISSKIYSTQVIAADSQKAFTPYEQLTEEKVLEWVWQSGVDKLVIENAVQQQIQNQITPSIVAPQLPW
jgi:hypothetical protein